MTMDRSEAITLRSYHNMYKQLLQKLEGGGNLSIDTPHQIISQLCITPSMQIPDLLKN